MVRKIEYELDDVGKVSPSIVQQAGVQGDHRATTVEFNIPKSLIGSIDTEEGEVLKYRFDVYTGAGTYKNYEPIEPVDSGDHLTASLPLEEAVTRHGGKITVVLLIIGDKNDSTEHVIQSFPVQLKLAQKPSESGIEGDSREELETLVVKAEKARDKSREYSVDSERYADSAKDSADRAEEIKEELEGLDIVKTVNGKTGDVELSADDIMYDSSSVSYHISQMKTYESYLGSALTTAQNTATTAKAQADSAFNSVATLGGTVSSLQTSKQDKLEAGDNIKIVGNRISATGAGGGAVNSVNGRTGDVTLTATDIDFYGRTVSGAISDVESDLSILNNDVQTNIKGQLSYAIQAAETAQRTADDAMSTAGGASIGVSELQTSKQDKLTAGDNITIEGNVISARGGGGAGNYELIETIAITEAQTSISRSEEPNNNNYNFKKLLILLEDQQAMQTDNWIKCTLSFNSNMTAFPSGLDFFLTSSRGNTGSRNYGAISIVGDGGVFSAKQSPMTTNPANIASCTMCEGVKKWIGDGNISGFTLENQTAFRAGYYIKIYGVRAG